MSEHGTRSRYIHQKCRCEPCTYHAAHKRLSLYRGAASGYECEWCQDGTKAEEWSYSGGSPVEQTGERVVVRGDRKRIVLSVWSGDVSYYQPLCRKHHRIKDGQVPHE